MQESFAEVHTKLEELAAYMQAILPLVAFKPTVEFEVQASPEQLEACRTQPGGVWAVLGPHQRRLYLPLVYKRGVHWAGTLRKLADPSDFQAAAAAVRALFEVLIDVALLFEDRSGIRAAKMETWEKICHHKAAKRTVSLFESRGQDVPDRYSGPLRLDTGRPQLSQTLPLLLMSPLPMGRGDVGRLVTEPHTPLPVYGSPETGEASDGCRTRSSVLETRAPQGGTGSL